MQLTSSPVNGSLSSWVDGNWWDSCSPHQPPTLQTDSSAAPPRHGPINHLMMSYRADRKSEHTKTHTYTNQKCFYKHFFLSVFLHYRCFLWGHFELRQNYAFSNSTSWWAVKMTCWLIDREGKLAFFSQFWVRMRFMILVFRWSGDSGEQDNQPECRGWGAFTILNLKIW